MFHETIRRRRHPGFHGQAASIVDAEGRFVNVSPSLASFFRCDPADMIGTRLLGCIPPDEADQVAPIMEGMLDTDGDPKRFQVQLRAPSGDLSWVRLTLSTGGTDPEGQPLLVALFEEPPAATHSPAR